MKGFVKDVRDIVKEVQCVRKTVRGVATLKAFNVDDSGDDAGVTISLSGFTNVNKMVAIIDGGAVYTNNTVARHLPAYVESLTVDTLVLRPLSYTTGGSSSDPYKDGTVSYQVIEFY